MFKPRARAIFLGSAIFLGLLIAKIIGNEPVTFKTFIPPAVGGLVAGIVVYFLGIALINRKKH